VCPRKLSKAALDAGMHSVPEEGTGDCSENQAQIPTSVGAQSRVVLQ
jgi:hypothetical protein